MMAIWEELKRTRSALEKALATSFPGVFALRGLSREAHPPVELA
jgi:hypothetical protein